MYLVLSIIFACLVTWNHAHALKMVMAHRSDSEAVRKRYWNRHLIINGILWLLLLGNIVALQAILPRIQVPIWARLIGLGLIITGISLAAWVRILLGRDQTMGKRFFFPETFRMVSRGPFKLFRNPMYNGFILVLIGMAFTLGIYENLVLAGTSFILLNLWLSRIENFDL